MARQHREGGIQIGNFLRKADGNFANACKEAFTQFPSATRFIVPMGKNVLTRPIDEFDGLRSNICIDGLSPESCIIEHAPGVRKAFIYRSTAPNNVSFRNIKFNLLNAIQNFGASIQLENSTNTTIDNCYLTCTFPNKTEDGIYNAIQLLGGNNLTVSNCKFDGTQVVLCGNGRSVNIARCFNNIFTNCNDIGVSCVSGGPTYQSVKNVSIYNNQFSDLIGGGYIYIGADGSSGMNPDISDIQINNNICSGIIKTQFLSGKTGIICSTGLNNKRITISDNQLSNCNPSLDTSPAAISVYGIRVFLRNGVSNYTEDLILSNNLIDFRTINETFYGLSVSSPGVNGANISENTIRAGSRGFLFDGLSDSEIKYNKAFGCPTTSCTISSSQSEIENLFIFRNKFNTTGTFKSSVLFQGNKPASKIVLERNRLESPNYSIINSMTSSLQFSMNKNSVNAPKHVSAVPSEETDTVFE